MRWSEISTVTKCVVSFDNLTIMKKVMKKVTAGKK